MSAQSPAIRAKQDCFFVQLLRQCSLQQQQTDFPQPFTPYVTPKEKVSEQNAVMQEFLHWKGLDDSHQEQTKQLEPKLMRAQSLRMEQERKINSFISVFGTKSIDPLTGQLRSFSPQKHKKIAKGKK